MPTILDLFDKKTPHYPNRFRDLWAFAQAGVRYVGGDRGREVCAGQDFRQLLRVLSLRGHFGYAAELPLQYVSYPTARIRYVAGIARYDVNAGVREPLTGCRADVQTNCETVWRVPLLNQFLYFIDDLPALILLRQGQVEEVGNVLFGRYQRMAFADRKPIENGISQRRFCQQFKFRFGRTERAFRRLRIKLVDVPVLVKFGILVSVNRLVG